MDRNTFDAALAPLRRAEWVVYAKRPFAGPGAVLAYLSRYTHRVAISNSRLVALGDKGVTFRWKDYRIKGKTAGNAWIKTMTLPTDEFIRRFLLHVLPGGFHRIRHYGLFANGIRADISARLRHLLAETGTSGQAERAHPEPPQTDAEPTIQPCPCCGGRLRIIERFAPGTMPRTRPTFTPRVDTS